MFGEGAAGQRRVVSLAVGHPNSKRLHVLYIDCDSTVRGGMRAGIRTRTLVDTHLDGEASLFVTGTTRP